jgi:para-aminobenzoate synthetase component 1
LTADPPECNALPFVGGAIGYVTYEYALRYTGTAAHRGPLPDYYFGLYHRAFVYDHRAERGYWIGDPGRVGTVKQRDTRRAPTHWQPSVDRDTYSRHVNRILEHIAAGDIYQANYTVRFESPGEVDAACLAVRLQREIPTPMGAYLGYPFGAIWSVSPERLVSGRRGERVESRPIKGTRPRAADPKRDSALAQELAADPKERAELLMIVDLVRNDLGRLAPYGTVKVERLFEVETYANVHHLEAIVSAALPAGLDWPAVLAALLPGGSVTGAPKRRATEILGALEPAPRSVYTGAVGYVSAGGHADFNLPIRTAYHDGSRFYLHSGSGIVADSVPEREYEEMLVKVDNIRRLLGES